MKSIILAIVSVLLTQFPALAQEHPSILLTRNDVKALRAGVTQYPLLRQSYKSILRAADKAIQMEIAVPQPTGEGGSVAHERHKRNYLDMQMCGIVYQISGEKKYAEHVKKLLLKYAEVYNSWPRHPNRKIEPGGKMFWQNLNDCVWMVYTVQGYDCIYDYLTPPERQKIERELFEPVVKELSEVNTKIFNQIHNHGTWSVAAVGMAGYVCGRKDWVEKALKGSALDGKGGFLAQLDQLFSPDGYYAEGPYYQRYAILPFILFARAIHRYQPELNIYGYRDGLLKKAVDILLQMTYTNKVFFPFNDALKDKTYESEELVYAVNIAYSDMEAGDDLLDIAGKQGRVIVSDAGLKVARAIAEGKTKPFRYRSLWIRDGAQGDEGGIGVLRNGPNENQACLVFKAASQGMGHGHFDRLNILFFDNNVEVFSDYGSARFLNIETKSGGRYTRENDTWAKQTIAHNTLVVDGRSHFNANLKKASATAPKLLQFESNDDYQVVSAIEEYAVPDVRLERSTILFHPEKNAPSLLIDVFRAKSDKPHRYELPFWYQGHLVYNSFPLSVNTNALKALGADFGYQHVWLNATGNPGNGNATLTVLNNKRFYSTTFLSDSTMKVQLVTSGAGDPNFNIRSEKAFILLKENVDSYSFLSITEPHGSADPVTEATAGASPQVKGIKMLEDSDYRISFEFRYKNVRYTVEINHQDKKTTITKNQ
jgi:Heparinase II/III-like protein.